MDRKMIRLKKIQSKIQKIKLMDKFNDQFNDYDEYFLNGSI
jgi:hypothetical protein